MSLRPHHLLVGHWCDVSGKRLLRFRMSDGVTVQPDRDPDPRWAAFQSGGVSALTRDSMHARLANVRRRPAPR